MSKDPESKAHPRFREVPLAKSRVVDPNEQASLKLVLFNKEEKLRSHTVKHLTNLAESHTTWRGLTRDQEKAVTKAIGELQRIGCPFLELKMTIPPCRSKYGPCDIYDECSQIIDELQEIYVGAVQGFVEDGAMVPRYAHYYSDRDHNEALSLMPSRPVVVKATQLEGDVYNLVTCYGGVELSFEQMRDLQVDMIKNEARSRHIQLHDDFAWGFDPRKKAEPAAEPEKTRKPAKKRKKSRRFKGGGSSWRKFLDE